MKIALALCVIALAGCATKPEPMAWTYTSKVLTKQAFYDANYACLQQAQQQYGSAFVNSSIGSADNGMTTNKVLYLACMQQRGFVWLPQSKINAQRDQRPSP